MRRKKKQVVAVNCGDRSVDSVLDWQAGVARFNSLTGRVTCQTIPVTGMICDRADFICSCVRLLLHAWIDLPVVRFAQTDNSKTLEDAS